MVGLPWDFTSCFTWASLGLRCGSTWRLRRFTQPAMIWFARDIRSNTRLAAFQWPALARTQPVGPARRRQTDGPPLRFERSQLGHRQDRLAISCCVHGCGTCGDAGQLWHRELQQLWERISAGHAAREFEQQCQQRQRHGALRELFRARRYSGGRYWLEAWRGLREIL